MEILPLLIISGITSFILSQIGKKLEKPVNSLGQAFAVISSQVANTLITQGDPISFLLGIFIQGIGTLIGQQMNIEQQLQGALNQQLGQLDAFTQAIANAFLENRERFSEMLMGLAENTFNHVQQLEQQRRDELINLESTIRPHFESTALDVQSELYSIELDLSDLLHEQLNSTSYNFMNLIDFTPDLASGISDLDLSIASVENLMTNAITSQIFKAESLVPTMNEITVRHEYHFNEKILEKYFSVDEEQLYQRLKTQLKVYSRLQLDALKEMQELIDEAKRELGEGGE